MSKTSRIGQFINNRFKVTKKIGAGMVLIAYFVFTLLLFILGAFGEIYIAEDTSSSNQKYAIKFESTNSRFLQLPTEYRLYETMAGVVGFPQCIAYDRTSTDVILVMDLLGKNLKELYELCGKKLSLKTVLYIALQTLTRIEALHSKKYGFNRFTSILISYFQFHLSRH